MSSAAARKALVSVRRAASAPEANLFAGGASRFFTPSPEGWTPRSRACCRAVIESCSKLDASSPSRPESPTTWQ
jgi:hypothetical protein